MAEINLLQKNSNSQSGKPVFKILNICGYLLLVAVVVLAGYQYVLSNSATAALTNATAEASSLQAQVSAEKNNKTVFAEQARLAAFKYLLNNHLDWSQVLPDFSNATLKNVQFSSFTLNTTGQVSAQGTADTFADLDKLIQGYQLDDFKSYINDVSLVSVGLSNGETRKIEFTLNLKVNTKNLLEPQFAAVAATPAGAGTAPASQNPLIPAITPLNGGAQ